MSTSEATLEPVLGTVTIFGSGRLLPTVTALVGLAAAILGWRAVRHARGANLAVGLGAPSAAFGAVLLLTADGGPGTGNGVVGSGAAIVLGTAAVVLGALARTRHRTPAPATPDALHPVPRR